MRPRLLDLSGGGGGVSCSVCLCTHHFAYHPDDACEIKGCGCTQFRVLDQTAWAKKKREVAK